jgi:hypothetical protein
MKMICTSCGYRERHAEYRGCEGFRVKPFDCDRCGKEMVPEGTGLTCMTCKTWFQTSQSYLPPACLTCGATMRLVTNSAPKPAITPRQQRMNLLLLQNRIRRGLPSPLTDPYRHGKADYRATQAEQIRKAFEEEEGFGRPFPVLPLTDPSAPLNLLPELD